MRSDAVKVFIVDDDPSVCRALSRLIDAAGYPVETFTSAANFLARERYTGVGCLILDVSMPNVTGIELQQHLNARHNDLPVVFLTGHGNLPMGIKAMKQGASDFLTKPADEIELLDAVEQALESHRKDHLNKRSTEQTSSMEALTGRELQVLKFILGGAINKQIAYKLCISEKTVKAHRSNLMRKIGVSSAAKLGVVCTQLGISPEDLDSPES